MKKTRKKYMLTNNSHRNVTVQVCGRPGMKHGTGKDLKRNRRHALQTLVTYVLHWKGGLEMTVPRAVHPRIMAWFLLSSVHCRGGVD